MSKLFVDLNIALRSLIQHSRRTLFLGTAIGSVTTLLILLTGLSTGIRETMIDTATTLSSGHLNVGGFYKITAGQAGPVVTDYQHVLEVPVVHRVRRVGEDHVVGRTGVQREGPAHRLRQHLDRRCAERPGVLLDHPGRTTVRLDRRDHTRTS